MYSRPSVSMIRLPDARATKNGSPPTEPNARTGELTPPGMRACARVNQSLTSGVEAFGDGAREIGEDEVGPGSLDRKQVLVGDRGTVEPAELRGGLHHRVLAAHVVRGDGNVDRGA